jgi:hypothetical protein
MALEKRRTLPRILEDIPEYETVSIVSSIEPKFSTPIDLSNVFEILKESHGQLIGVSSLKSPLFTDRLLSGWKDIDFVTREEEEAHLREALPHERKCIKGEECEALNLEGPLTPFIMVEHLTAAQKAAEYPPAEAQLCILDKRVAQNYLYLQSLAEKTDHSNLFTSHANLVNLPGEYDISQCMLASNADTFGLAPCVIHCRPCYEYFVHPVTGVQYFRQTGYRYPEMDF